MLLDFNTVRCLELVQNLQNEKSTDNLFGLLNKTKTAMGARALRANILQPLTQPKWINPRLDVVEEFTKQEDMYFQASEALKNIPDMDRLCLAVWMRPVVSMRRVHHWLTSVFGYS